jgi:hypothetical protein
LLDKLVKPARAPAAEKAAGDAPDEAPR